jgi:hypothetical protein
MSIQREKKDQNVGIYADLTYLFVYYKHTEVYMSEFVLRYWKCHLLLHMQFVNYTTN